MQVHFSHKIRPPKRAPYLVSRPRINEFLSTIKTRRLITLVASAGYGKTSALTDFVHSSAPYPVCWYTLSTFDEDPWTFLSYLTIATAQQFPEEMAQLLALIEGNNQPSWPNTTGVLLRAIDSIQEDFILVLDDWHLVDHIEEVRDLVANLLSECPNCHIILASRVHPGIHNLMLLAGRRQLVGFDEDILRVDGSEVAAILGEEYQAKISSEVATALSERMDGWITGILLSYASTPTPVPMQATRQDITVGHPIYQFFVEQAFDRQSPDVQSFLLDSALLEDLHPTQCDMVLQRNDSGQMLSALRSQHLFISEVDAGVLRYHPLFREFLLERYRTTDAPHYHATALRIAEWYREQEQWSRAF
ncbi:MAG: hypothetical protein AAGF95_34845, partial [Chloroflexota bacterium]